MEHWELGGIGLRDDLGVLFWCLVFLEGHGMEQAILDNTKLI